MGERVRDRTCAGSAAERRAESALIARGYRVVERNYRARVGELDLVAYDGDVLVFVEVRSRADGRFGGTDLRIDLDRALLLLSWEQRAVLELTFYHGLAEQEVAQVLDIAPGTVKSRLYRAKTALRAQLEADDKVASHA